VHEHAPAGADARAPAHEVGAGGAEAVRAVDEEHVDRAWHLLQRGIGEGAHVADALGDPGAREVRRERLVVGPPRSASAAISWGPRSEPACGSMHTTSPARPRQHDRRAPAEGADLDHAHRAAIGAGPVAAANRRRACASVSQPSTSRAWAHASSKVTTARPPGGAGAGR
jgi:hypothetical protein